MSCFPPTKLRRATERERRVATTCGVTERAALSGWLSLSTPTSPLLLFINIFLKKHHHRYPDYHHNNNNHNNNNNHQSFHARSGRAYLFDEVANVSLGEETARLMTTGAHVVRDAFCVRCAAGPIGWHYVSAADASQAYKVGRTVLERAAVVDRVEGVEGDASSDDDGGP